MAIPCNTCRLNLEKYLCDVPSKWRTQIIDVICNYLDNQQPSCKEILDCLSDNVGLLDPQCLTDTPEEWAALSFTQQLQLIIDKVCEVFEVTIVYTEDTPAISLTGDGTVGDPLTPTLLLSADAGNTAEIHSDGLWVPGIDADTLCDTLVAVYIGDSAQYNTINQTSYDFLSTGDSGCEKISPPTGFAVQGSTRISAFGSMEWFDSADDANTTAVSGETVLLFNNTSANLTGKTGVNYFGVGQVTIGNFTATDYIGSISNITMNDVTIDGTSEISTSNVIVIGFFDIVDSKWHGGNFKFDTINYLAIGSDSMVDNIYSSMPVQVSGNGILTNSTIEFIGPNAGYYAGFYGALGVAGTDPVVSNTHVYSANTAALYGSTEAAGSRLTLSNLTLSSDAGHGALIYISPRTTDTMANIGNIVSKSVNGYGFASYYNTGGDNSNSDTNLHVNMHSILGYSSIQAGLMTSSGGYRNCTGFSENDAGIYISGGPAAYPHIYGTQIINCIGESLLSYGLKAEKHCYISGGTYISSLTIQLVIQYI